MSVFRDIWDRVTGADEAQKQKLAQDLDRWIGLRRRWRQNSLAFDEASKRFTSFAAKLPDSDPLIVAWYNLQDGLATQWSQIQAGDDFILGHIRKAVQEGRLSSNVEAEYKRLLNESVGLGALPVMFWVIASAIGAAVVYVIVDQNNAKTNRDNNNNAAQLAAFIRLAELRAKAEEKDGIRRDLPPLPETPAGPIEKAVGGGIRGVGIAAAIVVVAVGGAFAYNASKKGGRK